MFKKKLKKLLTGLSIPQEYICLDLTEYEDPLSVILTIPGTQYQRDVTESHLFLGYKPLIIGLPFPLIGKDYETIKGQKYVELNFNIKSGTAKKSNELSPLATLTLGKITEKIFGNRAVLFFEGVFGKHSFLNPLNQFINRQHQKFQKDRPANISLFGNLSDQVCIAYAIPRNIAVVTVSDGRRVNMFPTDLHGEASKGLYLGSLRAGGNANKQVEDYKRIVLSEVSASSYRSTYALGKNHMADLKDIDKFSLSLDKSAIFNFVLPESVSSYRELRQIDSFDRGIHRIHIYEIVHESIATQQTSILAHIHQYYAQWRLEHGLQTKMLFR